MGRVLVATVAGLLFLTVLAAQVFIVRADQKADGASAGKSQPRELGQVAWRRGFNKAIAAAQQDDRPLLVLFDEVPGCSTCVGYGADVLSHPLIVEAAETLFIPVAVYNNIPGEDAETLKSFNEPAWNNPVVRIVDVNRAPLAPRVAEDYSVGGLAAAMAAALEKKGSDVPAYLAMLAEEHAARRHGVETATFAMHCFWEGEGALGAIPGVVKTRPGVLNHQEVVEVTYDPSQLSFASLLGRAKSFNCASTVFARNDNQKQVATNAVGSAKTVRTDDIIAVDSTPKYYLAQTPLRFVPMTELQAARVNAAVGQQKDPAPLLSPRQLALLEVIQSKPDTGWQNAIGADDLAEAWATASQKAGL